MRVEKNYSLKLVRLSDLQMLMWITTRILRQVERQAPLNKNRFKQNDTRSNLSSNSTTFMEFGGLLSNVLKFEVS